jgi:Sulfotransferase family
MPLLMVTGHQRSGTTILRILLNSHPEIAVTHEFANLKHLGRSRAYYSAYILRQTVAIGRKGGRFNLFRNEPTSLRQNLVFIGRYLLQIQRTPSWRIGFSGAESALHGLFPNRRWVGDKFPDYIWSLKYFAGCGKLACIVIYRDARDVVSSTLANVRTVWKDRHFVHAFDTPGKVATRWVKSIELMESCAGKIIPIRYERLMSEPKAVADELGRALDVNPAYFPMHILHNASIGKHRTDLEPQALTAVELIAGETLARLGYS